MSTLLPPRAAGVAESGIRRAAVIGAGSMGAGIAAQFANAGVPVDLLDIAGADTSSRDAAARGGIERQLKAGGFMHPDAAGLVRPGNVEDHMDRLAEADWIVEAIIENVDLKRVLYRKIDAVRKTGSIVSSNTSTIPRAALVEGASGNFAADFVITHFFNPPRMMRLVEIVGGTENPRALLDRARAASEAALGKTVVDCRDTPGFIANRIGCHWIAVGIIEAKRLGLTIEEADAVMAALGVPRTGVFGLIDLIGIDLVPHVWGSLIRSLPSTDDIHRFDLPGDALIRSMIEKGQFGRKARAGFYRIAPDKSREALDLTTGLYRKEQPVAPAALPGGGRDLKSLLRSEEKLGRYAAAVLSRVVRYAAGVGPEIAGDVGSIDVAMVLGYAWRQGPFALADRAGAETIGAILKADGQSIPPLLEAGRQGFFDTAGKALSTDGTSRNGAGSATLLSAAKAAGKVILGNEAASLVDLGNGVACFEMHTKLNSFAPAVLDLLGDTIARSGSRFDALVIGNDDPRAFSAGADLSYIAGLIRERRWSALEDYLSAGQDAFLALKYAGFPVVAAGHGLALGGGCEFLLHADTIVAHAELNAGLPETKCGIVPGWGGCAQLLLRAQQLESGPKGPAATAAGVFRLIYGGQPSGSAADARANGILRPDDLVVMNRDGLLRAARNRAVDMLKAGYAPPEPALTIAGGQSAKLGIMTEIGGRHAAGGLSDADLAIADALATVLTGGADADPVRPLAESDILRLERQAVLQLAEKPATAERIAHMLATGKPLRN